jgi:predicted HicB family RNase H-like nuclease
MGLTERFNLLLDADMRTDLAEAADLARLTVNQWVRQAIREKLENDAEWAQQERARRAIHP